MTDYLNATRRSIAWIKKAHDAGELQLRPPFQRNLVWTTAQKSYLIDTILRGYPIPEIYVQETVAADGSERHIIVDGQQRIRACLEFIEGGYALDPKVVPDWPDMSFEEITEEQKRQVYGYNFIARQLPDVAEEQLRAIFSRLNRNTVALNQQELRHATYWGEFITCVEQLSDLEYWSTSGIFTARDVRRMLDIEYVAELVVGVLHGVQNKKASLDKWFETYEREFPDRKRVEDVFSVVLGELRHLVPSISVTRWSKKSDFYSLFLVLAAHAATLPLAKTQRTHASSLLITFGSDIDKYIRKGGTTSQNVRTYVGAVEKAASDLANRRARQNVLEAVLEPVFG
jgi:hypothetical protein